MTPQRLLAYVSTFVLMLAAAGCASTTPESGSETASASESEGYVTGSGQMVRDGSGRCVQTGSWKPEDATRACEPEMFARLDAEKAKEEADRRAQEEQEAARRAEAEAEARRAETEAAAAAAAAAAAKQPEPVWRTVGADAFFATDKAELNDQSKRALDALVTRARDAEEVRVAIVGHADSRGDPDNNMSLSQRRADAVRAYLVEQGLPETAIDVDARGQNDPVLDCSDRSGKARLECLQVNRRSEIVLSVLEPSPQ